MNYDKVTIKQLPDQTSIQLGLAKYNRSKAPNTFDSFVVMQSEDGRYITGLDEEALSVKFIKDREQREQKSKDIKELREYLESNLHKDLSGISPYWEDFRVDIRSNEDLTLYKTNPIDVIRYHILISNGYVAPSEQEGSHPRYLQAKYYAYNEARESETEISTQKIRHKALAQLLELSEDQDKFRMIGEYLEGRKYKRGMNPVTGYKMLSDFINKDADNLKAFSRAVKLSNEELMFKITIDQALKKKHLKYKEGQYTRGGVNFGKNIEEVYSNLKKPEYATEFMSIQEELELA